MTAQLEYPEKMYPVKNGKLFSSRQMLKMQEIGINKIEEQLKTETNTRKIKTLKNRLREIKLFILLHPDIKQFQK
jgi:ribosomal protein L20A (L18A)